MTNDHLQTAAETYDNTVQWLVNLIVNFMKDYNNEQDATITGHIYSKIEVLCDVLNHMGFNTAWDYKDGIFYKFYISIPFEVRGKNND